MKKSYLMYAISVILAFSMFTGCGKKETAYVPAENRADSVGRSMTSDEIQIQVEMERPQINTEEYKHLDENAVKSTAQSPVSTFSIDVDTASYSNVRRFIMSGSLPPEDAVRTEELVNYFSYNYPQPKNDEPFAIITEVGPCPWNSKHKLAMIGLQGKNIHTEQLPPSNLVFLLDVSGSMNEPNKLPLVKSAMKLLVNNLTEKDRISMVVYAGAAGVVLQPTSGDNKEKILSAIEELSAGGSTAGGEGIELAYKLAKESFIKEGNNRVILATDGDFNVGLSSEDELVKLIEEKRKDNIYLSVLGFGDGNYKDSKMEALADKGNGNYAYIDSILEAKKVLVEEIGSTLLTIAKDVKIQVEFNPAKVKGYRLVGYENRVLNNEDFKDDTKDAGELGAGHTVTAFYEIIPADSDEQVKGSDELKYQDIKLVDSNELMAIKLRYKLPEASQSTEVSTVIKQEQITENPSQDFIFASAVAEFGHLLRNSEYKGEASFDHILSAAREAKGADLSAYRSEFIKMVELAKEIKN
jgi:Ca-activated chloride channel family protein